MPDKAEWRITVLTAVLVLLIAAAVGAALWLLHSVYRRSAQHTAAGSVRETAKLMTAELAGHPAVSAAGDGKSDWKDFARLVHSFHRLESGLQDVSVTHDGITVFQEQAGGLEEGAVSAAASGPVHAEDIRLGRELLVAGSKSIPLVTFAAEVTGRDGRTNVVKIGLRREAVLREQSAPSEAIAAMFKVSLVITIAAFCVCAALVVWMMRRDLALEKRRRQSEHLTFAGALANGIAHDFRNPMSSLKLDVQMLRKEADKGEAGMRTDRIGELSARAVATMERMDKVFEEFLFLSRPALSAGERIVVDECVADCINLLAARFEQTRVRVATDFRAGGAQIVCSPSVLKRALVNVLTNALQFSAEGGEVAVRTFADRGRAVIEVLDRGPGIPPENMKRIFEVFFTTRPGGTGLGLALARTAVENCGGSIVAENRGNGGACFRISIPAA